MYLEKVSVPEPAGKNLERTYITLYIFKNKNYKISYAFSYKILGITQLQRPALGREEGKVSYRGIKFFQLVTWLADRYQLAGKAHPVSSSFPAGPRKGSASNSISRNTYKAQDTEYSSYQKETISS